MYEYYDDGPIRAGALFAGQEGGKEGEEEGEEGKEREGAGRRRRTLDEGEEEERFQIIFQIIDNIHFCGKCSFLYIGRPTWENHFLLLGGLRGVGVVSPPRAVSCALRRVRVGFIRRAGDNIETRPLTLRALVSGFVPVPSRTAGKRTVFHFELEST